MNSDVSTGNTANSLTGSTTTAAALSSTMASAITGTRSGSINMLTVKEAKIPELNRSCDVLQKWIS